MKLHLSINNLMVPVILGVTVGERSLVQQVQFSMKIQIEQNQALLQDNIADLLDYDYLCQKILEFVASKEFLTIEYLCNKLFQYLKTIIPAHCLLNVLVTKLKLPVPYSVESASFAIIEIDG